MILLRHRKAAHRTTFTYNWSFFSIVRRPHQDSAFQGTVLRAVLSRERTRRVYIRVCAPVVHAVAVARAAYVSVKYCTPKAESEPLPERLLLSCHLSTRAFRFDDLCSARSTETNMTDLSCCVFFHRLPNFIRSAGTRFSSSDVERSGLGRIDAIRSDQRPIGKALDEIYGFHVRFLGP